PLARPHRRARLLHGDRHALALEDLDEHHGGSHAAVVHGCAGPVEQHSLDLPAVTALIREAHARASLGAVRTQRRAGAQLWTPVSVRISPMARRTPRISCSPRPPMPP